MLLPKLQKVYETGRGNEVSLFTNTVLFKRLQVFQVLSSTCVLLMTVLVVTKIKMLGERALEVLATRA